MDGATAHLCTPERAAALALTQSQPINYELHDPDVRLMLQVRDGERRGL